MAKLMVFDLARFFPADCIYSASVHSKQYLARWSHQRIIIGEATQQRASTAPHATDNKVPTFEAIQQRFGRDMEYVAIGDG